MPGTRMPTTEELADIQKGSYLTVKQLADQFALCQNWIQQLIRQKRIRAIKVGNRWRIPPEEGDRILREGIPPKPPDDKQPPVNVIRVPEDIRKKMMTSRRKPQEDPPPPVDPPSPKPKKNPYWPLPFRL